jgi:hypothetical protein
MTIVRPKNNDDSPSEKLMDETGKDKTYQSRIENLGAITMKTDISQ